MTFIIVRYYPLSFSPAVPLVLSAWSRLAKALGFAGSLFRATDEEAAPLPSWELALGLTMNIRSSGRRTSSMSIEMGARLTAPHPRDEVRCREEDYSLLPAMDGAAPDSLVLEEDVGGGDGRYFRLSRRGLSGGSE
ncbi:hypothetical protein KM043_014694 [Ampulex compressa]|nr:hypothetical protein KM043_014694 [Ampulex compressa]